MGSSSRLSAIHAELLLRCKPKIPEAGGAEPAFCQKLLSILHDIRRRRREGGAPCDRCFGPRAECVCSEPRVARCGVCSGPGDVCVCFYSGSPCIIGASPCDACVGCASRASDNRKALGELVDSTLLAAPDVSPSERPAMVHLIDSLLQALDGRRAPRLDQVRASIAGKMLGRIMQRACELLERIHRENYRDDAGWGRIFILIHDLRDVFVHSRVPAAVVHRGFGRLCSAVCDALMNDPDQWFAIPPDMRRQALCSLEASLGRALGGSVGELGFLGSWGRQRVAEVVNGVRA